MRKILILCINYNSYNELYQYLHSINIAATKTNLKIHVAVGDNTTENQQLISTDWNNFEIKVYPYYENLGYLGCAEKMMHDIGLINLKLYDFIIISNVDVKISESFFSNLEKLQFDNVGWVVPRIYTKSNGKEENPKMLRRPTYLKLYLFRLLYSSEILFKANLYLNKFKLRKKSDHIEKFNKKEIYAGHGALMIFTNEFIKRNNYFSFPSFMYGEEIYLAELVRLSGLKVVFFSNLFVETIGSASTGLLNNKYKRGLNQNSLKILQKKYFKL